MIGTYEPPTVVKGSPLRFGHEMQLAPGVKGFAMEHDGAILIPIIVAEIEGNGDVGRFIDSLSPRCVIPHVFNSRLMGMLVRRGWMPVFQSGNDYWRHPNAPTTEKIKDV